jgi:diguanylate cyclase (GGDEF)-like protein
VNYKNICWAGLLWLLGLFQGAAAQEVPGPVVLQAQAPFVSLDGRSQFWVDPAGTATIDQVATDATAVWELRLPGRQYNIDGKALWVRFDVQPQDTESHWFLELASSGLDRVQLFHRSGSGGWVAQEAGDTRPVSAWPLPGRFPTFEVSGHRSETTRFWLRIEHTRVNFATPIAIASQATVTASREREQFLLGAYFGLAALITVVAAANAVAFRDRIFAAYAVYVLALGVGQLAYLGVGAQHVWVNWLTWNANATFVLPGVSSAVGLWFVRMVTEPARFSRKLDLAVWALIGLLLAAVALDTVVQSRPTFAAVMLLTVVALALIMVLIGMVWAQGDDPAIRVIALGFLPVAVMALFPLARGLNLIPTSGLTRYGLTIGAALEMPILFYALSLRGTLRREAQVRAAALSRTDPLTGLAHARSLVARLEGALARSRSLGHRCALLAVRLSNHDAIVAQHGKETGDRALVLAASRLRRCIADVDMAARVGEQHFALLLEGPTTDVTAQDCATRVVASGLRESEVLPPGVTLRFHVAVAMLPEGQRDAAACLHWLQDVVDQMAQDQRKSIRMASV